MTRCSQLGSFLYLPYSTGRVRSCRPIWFDWGKTLGWCVRILYRNLYCNIKLVTLNVYIFLINLLVYYHVNLACNFCSSERHVIYPFAENCQREVTLWKIKTGEKRCLMKNRRTRNAIYTTRNMVHSGFYPFWNSYSPFIRHSMPIQNNFVSHPYYHNPAGGAVAYGITLSSFEACSNNLRFVVLYDQSYIKWLREPHSTQGINFPYLTCTKKTINMLLKSVSFCHILAFSSIVARSFRKRLHCGISVRLSRGTVVRTIFGDYLIIN